MKDESDKKFLQSYVYGIHGDFYVSTIYRLGSSGHGVWFYETLAWIWKDSKRTKGIADNSGAMSKTGAYKQHMEVIEQLEETGEYKELEED